MFKRNHRWERTDTSQNLKKKKNFTPNLCNFLVRSLQYFQKKFKHFFLPMKTWKNCPQKLLIIGSSRQVLNWVRNSICQSTYIIGVQKKVCTLRKYCSSNWRKNSSIELKIWMLLQKIFHRIMFSTLSSHKSRSRLTYVRVYTIVEFEVTRLKIRLVSRLHSKLYVVKEVPIGQIKRFLRGF